MNFHVAVAGLVTDDEACAAKIGPGLAIPAARIEHRDTFAREGGQSVGAQHLVMPHGLDEHFLLAGRLKSLAGQRRAVGRGITRELARQRRLQSGVIVQQGMVLLRLHSNRKGWREALPQATRKKRPPSFCCLDCRRHLGLRHLACAGGGAHCVFRS